MKIIDLSEKPSASGLASALGKARLSLSGPEAKAQEAAIQRLTRVLDNRFTLLRSLPYFPPKSLPVSVLVGPAGVWLLYASPLRGLFRAAETSWESDNGAAVYRPLQPNLIEELQRLLPILGAVLQDVLPPPDTNAIRDAEVLVNLPTTPTAPSLEAALFFTDPGAHIDSQRPAVRIVPADAIDRFAAHLAKSIPVLENSQVRLIIERLQNPSGEEVSSGEIAFSHLDGAALPQAPRSPSRLDQASQEQPDVIRRIDQRTRFTPRQWLIVGGLIALNIIIILIAILIALLTS
jgi:hypothetical protein